MESGEHWSATEVKKPEKEKQKRADKAQKGPRVTFMNVKVSNKGTGAERKTPQELPLLVRGEEN